MLSDTKVSNKPNLANNSCKNLSWHGWLVFYILKLPATLWSYLPKWSNKPSLLGRHSQCVTSIIAYRSGFFCRRGVKIKNHAGLWDTKLAWYSLSATRRVGPNDLELDFGIHTFRPSWPHLIVEVLVTRAKYLQPIVINYAFTFRTANILVASTALWPSSNSLNCTFISVAFKLHSE